MWPCHPPDKVNTEHSNFRNLFLTRSLDAIWIINSLPSDDTQQEESQDADNHVLDTNRDGAVTALDAFVVINELTIRSRRSTTTDESSAITSNSGEVDGDVELSVELIDDVLAFEWQE